MKTTLKTLAIAGLLGTVSAPAFAAAHMSASMTCAEYKALTAEEQVEVAAMAIAEIEMGNDGGSLEEGARADEDVNGDEQMKTSEEEATDGVVSTEGSVQADTPKAVEPTNSNMGDDMMSEDGPTAENIEELMLACDQNLDQMVSEAAANMIGVN